MLLTIAIPAYNRPHELGLTLASLSNQCGRDVEILVCEDHSAKGAQIARVVSDFKARFPELSVNFKTNEENLGYDANLRHLVELAHGDFIFFLGDDDIVPQGAIARVLKAISTEGVGVVLRAWRAFDTRSGQILDEHRYFDGDRIFEPGPSAVAAFYRRSVFISGLTIKREPALKLHTVKFDGTLLYQLYLVGHILQTMRGYYIDDFIAERRSGGEHFFGSSKRERGYEAGKTEAAHSERFVRGLFTIANSLDTGKIQVASAIREEIANYSFPLLEIQASRIGRLSFLRYGLRLAGLGLWRSPLFWIYFCGLTVLGPRFCNAIIRVLYKRLGRTPLLSGGQGKKAKATMS